MIPGAIQLGAFSRTARSPQTSPGDTGSHLPEQSPTLWQRLFFIGPRRTKSLRLAETLPLGERRFVAVIEFEQMRFLIGGTPSSLSLLAQLDAKAEAITPGEAARSLEPGGSL